MHRRVALGCLVAVVVGALCGGAVPRLAASAPASMANLDLVREGRLVYAGACASCHGRNLQGQPLWRLQDEDRGRRAPALDASGWAWRRSDAELATLIQEGHGTPRYKTRLRDQDVLAVTAFMKARWPQGLQVMQATLNPGRQSPAAGEDWRFPPDCASARARVAASAPR